MNPKVSVNVLNYNGKNFLEDCINGLIKQDYFSFEIVIIDNKSSDGSLDFLKKRYSFLLKKGKLKIISLKKNYGFAGAYNLAYKKNNSPYFLLLNNDVIIEDNYLIKKMVASIEDNKKIASVGVLDKPVFSNNKKLILQGTLGILQTIYFQKKTKQFPIFSGGVCCMIRNKIVPNLFDNDYFAYAEDSYLGMRFIFKGYLNKLVGRTVILHHGSGTTKKGSPFIRYHSEKNRIMNLLIFYDSITLVKIFPIFLLHLLIQDLFYLIRPKLLIALFKAHFYILKNLSSILKKREKIQQEKKITPEIFLEYLSYKIFTEEFYTSSIKTLNSKFPKNIYFLTARIFNNFSLFYCKLLRIPVGDIT